MPHCLTAPDEALPLGLHQLTVLLAAGFPEVVGLREGVTSELLRHPHHRFLVDHQPIGVPEHLFRIRMEVLP